LARKEEEITKRVQEEITKKVTADISARLETQFAVRFEIMFNSANISILPATQDFESLTQASNFSLHEDIQVIHILISFKKLKYF
jgi:hypothetical protein